MAGPGTVRVDLRLELVTVEELGPQDGPLDGGALGRHMESNYGRSLTEHARILGIAAKTYRGLRNEDHGVTLQVYHRMMARLGLPFGSFIRGLSVVLPRAPIGEESPRQ